MTIAAVYRFDNKAIFVSDFRVTYKTNLHDICIKVEIFDEIYMGLFLAGDIESWKLVITKLRENMHKISFENIFSDRDAFYKIIKSNVGACKEEFAGKKIGALGFILDLTNNKNKVFSIDGQMGTDVTISEVNNDQLLIIGSAEEVPNIRKNAEKILTAVNKDRFKDEIGKFALVLRENIKSSFRAAGTDSYEKLGVSPVMALAVLEEARFAIIGEEVSEVQIDREGKKSKKYVFAKNEKNEVILKDDTQEVVLASTFNIGNYKENSETFWEGFKTYDPSSEFSGHTYCYHLHQWFIPEKQTLYRILYIINFIGHKKLCNKVELVRNIKEDVTSSNYYEKQVDIYFIPIDDLQRNAVENISKSNILDDVKLRGVLGEGIFNKLFVGR